MKAGALAGAGLIGVTGNASAADDWVINDAPVVSDATYPTMGTDASNPTATVFGNFKCPNTQEFVQQNLDHLIRDFVKSGKLNLQFRTVAYEPHPGDSSHGSSYWYISSSDPLISEASVGVWDVDSNDYWQFFLDMFQNKVSGKVTLDDLGDRMSDSGVENIGTIRDRTAAGRYEDDVKRSKRAARDAGLKWTPWMEFRGDTASPHHDYSKVSSWLESHLPSSSATTQSTESDAGGSTDGGSSDGGSSDGGSSDGGGSDGGSLGRTITIDGQGDSSTAEYHLSVTGSLRAVDKTMERRDSVDGSSASGFVIDLADQYEFDGHVARFTADGPVDVTIDGNSVSVDDLPPF